MLSESSMNWTKNYPKDIDLEWTDITDRSITKIIQKPNFTFDNSKYNKNIKKSEFPLDIFD
jgi:hypothetical protein